MIASSRLWASIFTALGLSLAAIYYLVPRNKPAQSFFENWNGFSASTVDTTRFVSEEKFHNLGSNRVSDIPKFPENSRQFLSITDQSLKFAESRLPLMPQPTAGSPNDELMRSQPTVLANKMPPSSGGRQFQMPPFSKPIAASMPNDGANMAMPSEFHSSSNN